MLQSIDFAMELPSLQVLHIYLFVAVAIQGCYGNFQFAAPARNYTVIASESSVVTLKCKFSNAFTLKKTWMNGSKILFLKDQKISANSRVTLIGNNYQEFSIRIEQVNMYDEGEYICTIYDDNTDNSISQKVYLTVNVPAYLTKVSRNIMTVNEGDRFFLKCFAEGKPKPVILWRHLVPSGDGVMGTGSRLPILNITRHGQGLYECSADNNMGSPRVHTIQVYVRYPPEIHKRWLKKEYSSEIGKSIVIECAASSYPLPTFIWKHGDVIYKDGTSHPRVQVATAKYRKYTMRSKLNIDSVRQNDFGKYECIAENEKGRANMSIFLSEIVLIRRIAPAEAFGRKTRGENAAFSVHGLQLLSFVMLFLVFSLL